jgi:DNA-binding response OmpR family regulator
MIKHSILLIDDEPVILESLARDLECNNYSVSKAAKGEEALLMLREFKFELIITDLVMPGIGGMEVLRNVKNESPDSGVFILTGYGDMDSAIEALRLGADDYLVKPCDPDEMMIRVGNYMEKLETLRTLRTYEDILPICSYCKKIKDGVNVEPGTGKWITVEEYILRKSGKIMSHGLCPECFQKHKDD